MRKSLPPFGGRLLAFGTGKTRRGYPSPGFSGLIVSKFSYLISANIFSSAAAAPAGSHGRYLYQAAVRAAAALQDKGGIGLPIRLFTGTAAGIRGRKDDYGGARAAVGRKAGSSVLRPRKLSIKRSGNAENILHCRFFCTQNRIYRENVLLIPYKNERDYLLK